MRNIIGIDETPGTRLAVDFGRVGGYILKLAGGKKVHANNRNTLYKVAATYENLSKVGKWWLLSCCVQLMSSVHNGMKNPEQKK